MQYKRRHARHIQKRLAAERAGRKVTKRTLAAIENNEQWIKHFENLIKQIEMSKQKAADFDARKRLNAVCEYKSQTLYRDPQTGEYYELENGLPHWAQCETVSEWKSEIDAYEAASAELSQ